MKFEDKITYFRDHMGKIGIRERHAIPYYYRLFWKLGWQVPPPFFNSFQVNAVIDGFAIGGLWGILCWFVTWLIGDSEAWEFPIWFGVGFVTFGLFQAFLWHRKKKKYDLGKWDEYPSSI